jgi:ribosome modulation factor
MTYDLVRYDTRPLKTESTWLQGAHAARAGIARTANPYPVRGTALDHHARLDREGWDNGWRAARINMHKEIRS